MVNFCERLKHLRSDKKITGKELADALGISREAVSKWEIGRNYPNQEILNSLATYFDVSTDYLLGRTDDPHPFPPEDTRTIEERWNDPKNEFLYAMYGEVQDMTDEQKEELLNFVDYLKSKANKERK